MQKRGLIPFEARRPLCARTVLAAQDRGAHGPHAVHRARHAALFLLERLRLRPPRGRPAPAAPRSSAATRGSASRTICCCRAGERPRAMPTSSARSSRARRPRTRDPVRRRPQAADRRGDALKASTEPYLGGSVGRHPDRGGNRWIPEANWSYWCFPGSPLAAPRRAGFCLGTIRKTASRRSFFVSARGLRSGRRRGDLAAPPGEGAEAGEAGQHHRPGRGFRNATGQEDAGVGGEGDVARQAQKRELKCIREVGRRAEKT